MKTFDELYSKENLYRAWRKFRRGKADRADVIAFERNLEESLFVLSEELSEKRYRHGAYEIFYVRDPKFRVIHKATVRDRIVHQMVYDEVYPILNTRWFFDSHSCRTGKGTHRAIERMGLFLQKASRNYAKEVWILHGDVHDFFGSVDQDILFGCVSRSVRDSGYLEIIEEVIRSMETSAGKGMPLGNLTSQIFANAYLHELDRFAKHTEKIRRYVRYNDDFFVVSDDRLYLERIAKTLQSFIASNLLVSVPDEKIFIRRLTDGVDVLGSVFFPYGKVPRRRITRSVEKVLDEGGVSGYTGIGWKRTCSYVGLLRHLRSFWIQEKLRVSLFAQRV